MVRHVPHQSAWARSYAAEFDSTVIRHSHARSLASPCQRYTLIVCISLNGFDPCSGVYETRFPMLHYHQLLATSTFEGCGYLSRCHRNSFLPLGRRGSFCSSRQSGEKGPSICRKNPIGSSCLPVVSARYCSSGKR